MSKSIGQFVYEGRAGLHWGTPTFPWESLDEEEKAHWIHDAKVILAHAAQLLREQGEREPTYQLQADFERAAKMLEELE